MNDPETPSTEPGAALHAALAVLHGAAHAAAIQARIAGDEPQTVLLEKVCRTLDLMVAAESRPQALMPAQPPEGA